MPVIREWRCKDCSTVFESMLSPAQVECPTCAKQEPERVFMTPPAIRSPQTSRKDGIVKQLASDYGLSDVSNKHGEAVIKGNQQATFTSDKNVLSRVQQMGGGGDAFSPFLGRLSQPKPIYTKGPLPPKPRLA